MVSMPEAVDVVLSRVVPLPPLQVPFTAALGLVLAHDVVAASPHPPFAASVMDGYAVRAEDCPGTLMVTGASRAGAPMPTRSGNGSVPGTFAAEGAGVRGELAPGEAAYITTGAPIPAGANAVVALESCDKLQSPFGAAVYVRDPVTLGAHIRPVGHDVAAGEVVVPAGQVVGPHEIGIVAMVGAASVSVHSRPKLAVLSTGDELVDLTLFAKASTSLTSDVAAATAAAAAGGQVYDANRPMLAAAAAAAGAEVMDLGVVADDPTALHAAVCDALRRGADVLVTSGGVSEGDRDYLKEVLLGNHGGGSVGGRGITGVIHFGRVMMKPGKPLTFAEVRHADGGSDAKGSGGDEGGGDGGGGGDGRTMLVFALPGNPVSAAVTFQLTVLPALRRLLGWRDPRLRRVHCVLGGGNLALDLERPEYHRATLHWTCRQGFDAAQRAGLGGAGWGAGGATRDAQACLPTARSTGRQVSSRLTSMLGAEVLLELPRGPGTVAEGTVLSALVIGDLSAAAVQLPVIVPVIVTGGSSAASSAAAATVSTGGALPSDHTADNCEGGVTTAVSQKEKTAVVVVSATTNAAAAFAAATALVEAVRGAVPDDWAVSTLEVPAPAGSDQLAAGVARAAQGAALVVVAPAGDGGVTSAAAVVRGTRRGVPGVAWAMRDAVARLGDRGGSGGGGSSSGVGTESGTFTAEAVMLAHEAAGGGVHAGQVAGCVVVSAPPEHAAEALRAGLGELMRCPYAEWGLSAE
jgi:gephyrin